MNDNSTDPTATPNLANTTPDTPVKPTPAQLAQLAVLMRRMKGASKHRKPTKGAFGKSHFWDKPAASADKA